MFLHKKKITQQMGLDRADVLPSIKWILLFVHEHWHVGVHAPHMREGSTPNNNKKERKPPLCEGACNNGVRVAQLLLYWHTGVRAAQLLLNYWYIQLTQGAVVLDLQLLWKELVVWNVLW